ncbi:MAG: SPOR domain-containing protein, partial [Pseudomonadota bacterium]
RTARQVAPRRNSPQRTARTQNPILNTAAPVGRAQVKPRQIKVAKVKPISVLTKRQSLSGQTRQTTRVQRPQESSPSPISVRNKAQQQPIAIARAGFPTANVTPPHRIGGITSGGREAKTAGRQPSTLQNQMAALLRRTDVRGAPDRQPPPLDRQSGQSYEVAQRGRMSYGSRMPIDGGYLVQVGAYDSRPEAEARLNQVAAQEDRLLQGYRRLATPFVSGQRRLYRARFAGFDAKTASKTCTELRRRAIDCFVARQN